MLTHKVKFTILITALVIALADISAQYHFVNYDYTNGLPLDEITVIIEDSSGYMWFGGPAGLAKFDGRKFTHYYKGSPNGDLAGNVVYDIKVAPDGKLIILFDDTGISIYNPKKDVFKSRVYNEKDSINFPQHSLYASYTVNDSFALICSTLEGLFELNLNTLSSKRLFEKPIPRDIIHDETNADAYLFTSNGLHHYNSISQEIVKYTGQGFNGLRYIDGKVWYNGYFKFIFNYDLETHESNKYEIKSGGHIRGWAMVDNELWIGTPQGIEVINVTTEKNITTIKSGSNLYDLSGDFIFDIYKDSKERVWISTDGGVSLYDPSRSNFNDVSFLDEETTFLTHLANDKLLSLDFYSNRAWHIIDAQSSKELPITGGLKGPLKTVIFEHNILVLFFNGIGYLDLESMSIKPLETPFTNSGRRGLIDMIIKDDLWFGIYRYDDVMIAWNKSDGSIDTIDTKGEPRGMLYTLDNKIWSYGEEVLCSYNMATAEVSHYSGDNKTLIDLQKDIIYIDQIEDQYWISTRTAGVWSAEYNEGNFKLKKQYDHSLGLLNNTIVSTHVDSSKNLYVQNKAGIFKFNKITDRFIQVGQKKEVNIQKTHGLTSLNGDLIALGYQNKFIRIEDIDSKTQSPKIVLTGVKVNGTPIGGQNQNSLDLNHLENNLMISYDVIYFDDPSFLKFRYRLNKNEDWIYTSNYLDDLLLTALSDGDFKIQAAVCDKYGRWIEADQLSIVINPPYWRTWWFYLLSLGGLLLFGYGIYRWRLSQADKINNMKLKLAELEGESLRAQMNPHFVFNALNSIKSYIIKNDKEAAADYLTIFSELTRAILRNSKEKEISLQSELEALALYMQIEALRLNNKIDYQINIEESIDPNKVALPPLIIQPFVENSIWHGFINKEGRGNLSLNVTRELENIFIEIVDDGIGRKASKMIEQRRGRTRSYGISITQNRLKNITENTEIIIQDIYNKESVAAGTKVILKLPYKALNQPN